MRSSSRCANWAFRPLDPRDYGGLGLTMGEEVAVVRELGHTSPAFRSVFGTTVGSAPGHHHGRDDGAENHLSAAAGDRRSDRLLCPHRTGAGSDAASIVTAAKREGDHFVINGTKRYITNAPRAGILR